MIEIGVSPGSSDLRRARRALRDRLAVTHVESAHVSAVEVVANELLGAALENGRPGRIVLRVEVFARLTSVRVRCSSDVELRDEPFGVRERVIEGLAFAWGKRGAPDGSIDLWAELARPLSSSGSAPPG